MENIEKTAWSLRTLLQESGVRIQVPEASQSMRFVPACAFDSGSEPVVIPAHWKIGMGIPGIKCDTIYLNRHFYGFDLDDRGRKFTAIVKVVEKKEIGGDRVYTLVDIHKTNGPTVADLKISPEGDGILIAGTRTRINIVKRGSAARKLEAQAASPA